MILLPVITLILIFFFYKKKNKNRFGIVGLLVSTYLVMAGIALVLNLFGIFPGVFPIAFKPMAYLSICLIIVFIGFTGFKDHHLSAIKIENVFLYRVLENVLLVGGFLAIGFFLPFAKIAFIGNISLNRIEQEVQKSILPGWGIVNSIFSLLANLFILAQVFAFMNLIPRNGKRKIVKAFLLLVSSFSYIIYIFAYAGRDGVVYWIMSYLFCFFLFRSFITKDDLKKLKHLFAFSISVLLIPFILISISRFSESNEGTGWSILNYGGMQIGTFNDYYSIDAPLTYGRTCFPVFVKFGESLGFEIKQGPEELERFSYYLYEGVMPWLFSTFIGSIMADFGKIVTLAFLCLMSLITRKTLKKISATGIFDFSNLVLFILLYQIVYWGVFYFRQYSANFYMIFMILLFIMFKVSRMLRLSVLYIKEKETQSEGDCDSLEHSSVHAPVG